MANASPMPTRWIKTPMVSARFVKFALFFCVCLTSYIVQAEDRSSEHATVSIYAVHIPSGKVLLDENSDKSLMPSSCIKVITTAAALHILGPDSYFETHVEYDGSIDANGVLHGNLYIRGGGDPCLGSDRASSSLSWQKQLQTWAEAIQNSGIKTIEGSVIGDASKWETALAVPSWSWEDIGNYYGAGASALTFHENAYTLFFKPGKKVGDKTVILRTDPAMPSLIFQNEVITGPIGSGDQACIYGMEFSPAQYVRGSIPAGVSEFSIKGAIPDPSTFCATLLAQTLKENGMTIAGKSIQAKTKRTTLHTTLSPSIEEIVYWTNQKSINLYAEHLLKKMGETVVHEGSTKAGIKVVTDYWRSQGIDMGGLNMADGSGLSRKNLVTTKQFVSILLKMKQSKAFAVFFDSLPKKSDLISAKTGSMSLTRGYTGYAGDIAFAIIINQCSDPIEIKNRLDAFFLQLEQLAKASY